MARLERRRHRWAASARVEGRRVQGRPSLAAERLTLAELALAELGGWASGMLYRWHPPTGPFFASDGRVLADLTPFQNMAHEEATAHDEAAPC